MEEHRKDSDFDIKCAVITLSDSKFSLFDKEGINEDISGKNIVKKLNTKHEVLYYKIIPDQAIFLLNELKYLKNLDIDLIFLTGGTGIGKRDITIETIEPLFNKKIPGFGEIFRQKSYEKLGAGVLLSRATAGVYNDILIFALPGSPNAVDLGLEIIFDDLAHFVKHIKD